MRGRVQCPTEKWTTEPRRSPPDTNDGEQFLATFSSEPRSTLRGQCSSYPHFTEEQAEVMKPEHGHRASKWAKQNSNPGTLQSPVRAQPRSLPGFIAKSLTTTYSHVSTSKHKNGPRNLAQEPNLLSFRPFSFPIPNTAPTLY